MKKLILASGSPRRRTLLENYGFDITVIKPEFNENTVAESDPGALVAALALGKNRAVRKTAPQGSAAYTLYVPQASELM